MSVYIVTVGTPIKENNKVNKEMMKRVCKEISTLQKNNDLVILDQQLKLEPQKMTKMFLIIKQ